MPVQPSTPVVDSSNPLATGLVAVFYPDAATGTMREAVADLVTLQPTNAGAAVATTNADGTNYITAVSEADDTGWEATAPAALKPASNFTIFAAFIPTGDSTGNVPIAGVTHSDADVSPWIGYAAGLRDATNVRGEYNLDNTFLTTDPVPIASRYGSLVTVALTIQDGDPGEQKWYVDGKLSDTNTDTGTVQYAATAQFVVGAYVDQARTANVRTAVVQLYDRVLSASDIASLNTDPWQHLRAGVTDGGAVPPPPWYGRVTVIRNNPLRKRRTLN